MAPENTLYVVTPLLTVKDDDSRLEVPEEPEVYDTTDLANQAAKRLLRRIAHRFEPNGRLEGFGFLDSLDNEGLYCGGC